MKKMLPFLLLVSCTAPKYATYEKLVKVYQVDTINGAVNFKYAPLNIERPVNSNKVKIGDTLSFLVYKKVLK